MPDDPLTKEMISLFSDQHDVRRGSASNSQWRVGLLLVQQCALLRPQSPEDIYRQQTPDRPDTCKHQTLCPLTHSSSGVRSTCVRLVWFPSDDQHRQKWPQKKGENLTKKTVLLCRCIISLLSIKASYSQECVALF